MFCLLALSSDLIESSTSYLSGTSTITLLSLKFDSTENWRRVASCSNVWSPDLFSDWTNAMKSTTVALLSLISVWRVSLLVDKLSSSFMSWLLFVFRISPVGWNNERGMAESSCESTAFKSIWRDLLTVRSFEKSCWWSFRIMIGSDFLDIFNFLFSLVNEWSFSFLIVSWNGTRCSLILSLKNCSVDSFPSLRAFKISSLCSSLTIWPEKMFLRGVCSFEDIAKGLQVFKIAPYTFFTAFSLAATVVGEKCLSPCLDDFRHKSWKFECTAVLKCAVNVHFSTALSSWMTPTMPPLKTMKNKSPIDLNLKQSLKRGLNKLREISIGETT